MPSLCFVFPTLFLLFIFSFASCAYSFHDDQKSLLAFKKLITSDPNNCTADWSPAVPFCNWTAVTCTHRHPQRVVAVNLTGKGLGGPISPSLGNLSFLRTLDLTDNVLHGHIPTELGRLFRLRTLVLDGNQLEGNIPRQLSGCRDLTFLALEGNNLTGYIPQELGSLAHLQELNLGSNNLIEYGLSETISTKGDVYSYGILLLEMLTGKRPTSDMFVGDLNLHKWVNLAFPNKVKDVIDNGLFSEVDGDEFVENSIYKCLLSLLQVGLLCSKDSFDERPTMRDVVLVLENLREDLVANKNDFRRSRQSISTLLSKTNAARNKE